MKKNFVVLAIVALSALQCVSIENRIERHRAGANPYVKPQFYAKYLNTGSALDRQIQQKLRALAADPSSPALHNDLGRLLWDKGFPKDAEREFRRAIVADKKFYPAWSNLGLALQASGDRVGARAAFSRTVELKPGDAATLFELGLMAERAGRDSLAVEYYSKALRINPNLLDVRVNPRVLDTKLIPRALIAAYPQTHEQESVQFRSTPSGYVVPARIETPSPVPAPADIVTPTSPATEQGAQTPPPPSAPETPVVNPNPQPPIKPTPQTPPNPNPQPPINPNPQTPPNPKGM
jgi:Tfp pilus assembly protein PilF